MQTFCSKSCASRRLRPDRRGPGKGRHEYVRTPLVDLFWPRVERSPICWPTTGDSHRGYTTISFQVGDAKRRTLRMSHVAWFLATGHWPVDDELVLHVCDNPPCVRNDEVGIYVVRGIEYPRRGHLFLGTTLANVHDKIDKGRMRSYTGPLPSVRGEKNWNAKLTESDVREIRQMQGNVSQVEIARLKNVSQGTISNIFLGKVWSHVK